MKQPLQPSSTRHESRPSDNPVPEAQHGQDNPTSEQTNPQDFDFNASSRPIDWQPYQEDGVWNSSIDAQNLALGTHQAPQTGVDFSYLSDFQNAFAFTDWPLSPGGQQQGVQPQFASHSSHRDPNPVQPTWDEFPSVSDFSRVGLSGCQAPNATDQQFLQNQGCFSLPPVHILRQILGYYFQYIHPNLPIIDEYRFESLWAHEDYRFDKFSSFVFRSMMFAAIHVSLYDDNNIKVSLTIV